MVFQVPLHNHAAPQQMEGDGDDEDDDIDQQEPLPRLTTYKEASYNSVLEVVCYF